MPRKSNNSELDDVEDKSFRFRDVLLFPDVMVSPGEVAAIVVEPEVECLVQRIVMHRSIATRFSLLQIFVGATPRTRLGSGSCEIFLSDVPNWTPSRLVIGPGEPLRILVRNMVETKLRSAGTAIVYARELPKIAPAAPPVRALFGIGRHD